MSGLPDDLRQLLGLVPPAAPNPPTAAPVAPKPRRNKQQGEQGPTRPDENTLLVKALDEMRVSGRNNGGMWLACQLRDNGYSESEAMTIGGRYVDHCPTTDTKGKVDAYTLAEFAASCSQAYSSAAREPWGQGAARRETRSFVPGRDQAAPTQPQSAAEIIARAESRAQAPVIPDPEQATKHGFVYSERQKLALLGKKHWGTAGTATTLAYANRFKELAGEDLAFVPELGYLGWDGRKWRGGEGGRMNGGQVMAMFFAAKVTGEVQKEADIFFKLAGQLMDERREEASKTMVATGWAHIRAAQNIESRKELAAMLVEAGRMFEVDRHRFDPVPWRIGFANGVLDRGEFREHRRSDYMRQLSRVEYRPTSNGALWQKVLHHITGGDVELQHTLQTVAGYVLSGASNLRLVPWLYGPKGTGKSTFTELLFTVLSEMAAIVDTKQLSGDSARERLGAVIWNKRLVVCTEAGNARIDAELLKMLSGGDTYTVRLLFCEAFDAAPTHVPMMVANDAPKMDAYDEALKDRIIAIPFTHSLAGAGDLLGNGGEIEERIETARRDPFHPLVLGFAAWAVEGMREVMATKQVYISQSTRDQTAAFWKDVDALKEFWEEVDEAVLLEGLTPNALTEMYLEWCKAQGIRVPLKPKDLAKAYVARGLEKKQARRQGKLTWLWILPEAVTGVTGKTPNFQELAKTEKSNSPEEAFSKMADFPVTPVTPLQENLSSLNTQNAIPEPKSPITPSLDTPHAGLAEVAAPPELTQNEQSKPKMSKFPKHFLRDLSAYLGLEEHVLYALDKKGSCMAFVRTTPETPNLDTLEAALHAKNLNPRDVWTIKVRPHGISTKYLYEYQCAEIL